MSTRWGCLLALVIGLVTIAVVQAGVPLLTGSDMRLGQEWAPLFFNVLLVAAPFGLLAIAGVTDRLPWFVGIALTVVFWSALLFEAVHRRGDANTGLALLMLVSPALIAAGALLAHRLTLRPRA